MQSLPAASGVACWNNLPGRAWGRAGQFKAPCILPHRSLVNMQPPPAAKLQQVARSHRTSPPHNPTDMEGSPFHDLGLKEVMDGMGRVRIRQHVNPLRAEFQVPLPPPDWSQLYADPTLPLVLDLGCGPGRFLLLLQRHMDTQQQQSGQQQQEQETHQQQLLDGASSLAAMAHPLLRQGPCNFLGIEIRKQLVERANKWAASLGCQQRVHYLFANATVSLHSLLESYPGPLVRCCVQFPDPHFKRRHHKRRIIQPGVVDSLKQLLVPGGDVFLQSDVYEAAVAMRDAFEVWGADAFALHPLHSTAAVFQWTDQDQRAAARAAAAAAGGSNPSSSSSSRNSSAEEEQPVNSSLEEGTDADVDSSSSEIDAFVSTWAAGGWLVDNPLGVPTEREHYVQQHGGAVYRVLLTRPGPSTGGPSGH